MVLQSGSRVSSVWSRKGHVPPKRGNLNNLLKWLFGRILHQYFALLKCVSYISISVSFYISIMSLKIFYDASKWVQGFFGVAQERSRAAKTWQFEQCIKITIWSYFSSIFCIVKICKLYFNIYIVLHLQFNNVIKDILWCFKVSPGFLRCGPGTVTCRQKWQFFNNLLKLLFGRISVKYFAYSKYVSYISISISSYN